MDVSVAGGAATAPGSGAPTGVAPSLGLGDSTVSVATAIAEAAGSAPGSSSSERTNGLVRGSVVGSTRTASAGAKMPQP